MSVKFKRGSMYDTLDEAMQDLGEWKNKRKSTIKPQVKNLAYRPTFNTDCHREAVFLRFIELAESTFKLYEENLLVGAIVTARSAQETFAVMWYINAQLEHLSRTNNIARFLKKMNRLSLGWSNDKDFPEKINILDCIDSVDKVMEGQFRSHYDLLSEYAHPNYSGTLSVYTKPDHDTLKVEFGSYPRPVERLKNVIEETLIISISLLTSIQRTYDTALKSALEVCIVLHDNDELHDIFYKKT